MKILVMNGPNLNLLGTRKPEIYGKTTLAEIEHDLQKLAVQLNCQIECYQSNSEGCMIDKLHDAKEKMDGIIINAGAYTHTSIALRDAIEAIEIPCVEVHLSNIYQRETFRHHSYLAPVCIGQIAGFGATGYQLAVRALLEQIR